MRFKCPKCEFISCVDNMKTKYRYHIYADAIEDLEKYIIEFKNKEAGMPIKQLMTRAEVIKYCREVCGSSFTAEGWVNLFIAAGMLEIKEEVSPNYLMIKDIDGDTQKVDIAELILKLTFAGFEVKKK